MQDYEELIYSKSNKDTEIIEGLEINLKDSNKSVKEKTALLESRDFEVFFLFFLKINLILSKKITELKKQLNEIQRENEEFQDKVQIYLNNIRNNNENYENKIENLEAEVINILSP